MNKNKNLIILSLSAAVTAILMLVISFCMYGMAKPQFYNRFMESGNKYLNDGMYQAASLQFGKALEIDTDSKDARIGLAKANVALNNVDTAVILLREVQELDFDNEALLKDMIIILKDADIDAAHDLYMNYVNKHGEDNVDPSISAIFDPYTPQIELGYKYLAQKNYDEALLAFEKAIEIDADCPKAYIGKADVYAARCDQNALQDIKTTLENGYTRHSDDAAIIDALVRIPNELYQKDKRKTAIDLLNFGYRLTNSKKIEDGKKQVIDDISKNVLSELYSMFEIGNDEAVKKEIQAEKYLEFVTFVDNEEFKYIYFPNNSGTHTGKGIAFYYVGNEYINSVEFGNVFVYYGDFVNGIRSGNGTWVAANGEKYYWFEGKWGNDAPNGTGRELWYTTTVDKESNVMFKRELSGTYKHGLLDGTYTTREEFVNGSIFLFENVVVNNGVLAVNGCGISRYHIFDPDKYCAAMGRNLVGDKEPVHMMSSGELHGAVGFVKAD